MNGSPLDWIRYEFATREADGDIWIWATLEEAQAQAADVANTEIVMRAVYATRWTETL